MSACAALLCLSLLSSSPEDPWISEDKGKHLLTSFVVTSLSGSASRAAGLGPRESAAAGAAVGAGVGVWKELRDMRDPRGSASLRDLVWDLAGVGVAVLLLSGAR